MRSQLLEHKLRAQEGYFNPNRGFWYMLWAIWHGRETVN